MNWILENWAAILAGAAVVLPVLAFAARFTKNTKDDAIIAKIIAWLNNQLSK